jgi:hypothetical protein
MAGALAMYGMPRPLRERLLDKRFMLNKLNSCIPFLERRFAFALPLRKISFAC